MRRHLPGWLLLGTTPNLLVCICLSLPLSRFVQSCLNRVLFANNLGWGLGCLWLTSCSLVWTLLYVGGSQTQCENLGLYPQPENLLNAGQDGEPGPDAKPPPSTVL